MRLVLAALAALLLLTPTVTSASEACTVERTIVGLPDHQWSGNRVVESCEALRGTWRDFELDEVPAWIVPHPRRPGDRWVLAGPDGRVVEFHQGSLDGLEHIMPGEAPAVSVSHGVLHVSTRSDKPSSTGRSLPGGRSVHTGFTGAWLAGPTDRYPHGVLGDDVEASGLQLWTDHGATSTVELPEHEVIEGIGAIAAVLGDDGRHGFLVTVSDAEMGARLRAYDEAGAVIGESEPIGQGFRWLHQVGVGPTGPEDEIEIIAVRTPHIGGVVEAYRLEGDRLERVAAIEGYSSHQIGSPNLDMALLADTDGDGQLEVVVPTQSMTELAILERTTDGFREVARYPLGGRLATNVAAAIGRDGRLSLAAATEEGRLRIFR